MNADEIHSTTAKHNFLMELWDYRYALRNLILKDFRIRYRNMSLGILWSVLNPLVMLGVLVVVFSYINPNRTQQYFPLFILLGLISYNFFSMCVGAATNCVLENASLVKKVVFPRQILPIASVLSQVIHLLIQFALLAVFIAIFRVPVTRYYLWMAPILLVQMVHIVGLSFVFSAMNVYYRDAQYLVESGLRVMFWFTPIFYALPMVKLNLSKIHPWLYELYLLNPLAGCIDASRRAILEGRGPEWHSLRIAAAVSVVTFVFGFLLFQRVKKNFADKI